MWLMVVNQTIITAPPNIEEARYRLTLPSKIRFHPMHARHLIFTVVVCCGLASRSLLADEIQFERDVLPVLQAHCIRCHGPEVQEAKIRLDNLSTNLSEDRAATETWHEC